LTIFYFFFPILSLTKCIMLGNRKTRIMKQEGQ
jgi:hypothetical protein